MALAAEAVFGRPGSSKAQRFLSQKEAVSLRDHQAKEKRDKGSAALITPYQGKWKEYVVWYATVRRSMRLCGSPAGITAVVSGA